MNVAPFWEVLLTLAHFVGVGGVAMRVIWVRRPAGSAFAWLLLVALVPYVGVPIEKLNASTYWRRLPSRTTSFS